MAGKPLETACTPVVSAPLPEEEMPEGGSPPGFQQRPVSLALQEGRNATFRVQVCGDPIPEVHWENSQGQLSNSSKYQVLEEPGDREHTLQILKLTGEDTDVYRCKAINKWGEATCSARLTVIEVGFRKNRKRHKEAQEDLRKELVDFRKVLRKRAPTPVPEKKLDSEQVWQLLTTADRKDYEQICRKYGIVDFRGLLRKLQQMRQEREDRMVQYVNIVSNLRHLKVSKDGVATFSLELDLKDPESKVYLYKDGEMVPYGFDNQTKHCLRRLGKRYHFQIRDLKPEDAGIYQVKVEDAGVFSTQLEASAIPPRVEVPLAEARCPEEGDAHFQCSLSSPYPDAVWHFQHRPLRPSNKYQVSVSPDGLTHQLIVRGAHPCDMGLYSLLAGQQSSSAWLVVGGGCLLPKAGKGEGLLTTGVGHELLVHGVQDPEAEDSRHMGGKEGGPQEQHFLRGSLEGVGQASGVQPLVSPDVGDPGGPTCSHRGGKLAQGLLEEEGEIKGNPKESRGAGGPGARVLDPQAGVSPGSWGTAGGREAELGGPQGYWGTWGCQGQTAVGRSPEEPRRVLPESEEQRTSVEELLQRADVGDLEVSEIGGRVYRASAMGLGDPGGWERSKQDLQGRRTQDALHTGEIVESSRSLRGSQGCDIGQMGAGDLASLEPEGVSHWPGSGGGEESNGEEGDTDFLGGSGETGLGKGGHKGGLGGPEGTGSRDGRGPTDFWGGSGETGLGTGLGGEAGPRDGLGGPEGTGFGGERGPRDGLGGPGGTGLGDKAGLGAPEGTGLGDKAGPRDSLGDPGGTGLGDVGGPKGPPFSQGLPALTVAQDKAMGLPKSVLELTEKRPSREPTTTWALQILASEPLTHMRPWSKRGPEGATSFGEDRLGTQDRITWKQEGHVRGNGAGRRSFAARDQQSSTSVGSAAGPKRLVSSCSRDSMTVSAGDTCVPVFSEVAPVTQLKDGLSLSRRVTVRPSGSAHYHLQLSGPQGWDAASPSLLRAAACPRPPGPIRLLEKVAGTVTAEWTPSPDELGEPQLYYTVFMRSSASGPWRQVADRIHTTRFTLPGVRPGHQYHFRVVAQNDVGTSPPSDTCQPWCLPRQHRDKFTVKALSFRELDRGQKPRFLVGLRAHLLPRGSQCCMSCAVRGWPRPHVTWFRNGQSLVGDPTVHSTDVLGVCSLILPCVAPEDGGEYRAVAENVLGQAVSTTTLIVIGPPGPPGGVVVRNIEDTTVQLSWSLASTTIAPLPSTRCKRAAFPGGNWKPVRTRNPANIEGNAKAAQVLGLTPWMDYEFWVLASNILGTGEPSGPSSKIRTKEAGAAIPPCPIPQTCLEEKRKLSTSAQLLSLPSLCLAPPMMPDPKLTVGPNSPHLVVGVRQQHGVCKRSGWKQHLQALSEGASTPSPSQAP
ncbi:immunoglobulin-like and fibronectin type III domain-containing protein 1 [Suncus etruscus]|uniref:immunoglobulin-like and fibronectin type III domain-containing protein 1 n=1 Tax=Suncus etruscus TaxID=109475 RepID=UPI002110712D|nr:immunoglobulin-like and fibronectin type III domain-containing protein 1 [Suncus etruscus]